MFELLTDTARRSLDAAHAEALALNHEYLGTEHVLLGLLDTRPSVALEVLRRFAPDPELLRREVLRVVHRGKAPVADVQLPFTPRAKRALEMGWKIAEDLGDDSFGTQHLLLGLIAEREGIAGAVLHSLRITLVAAREELSDLRVGLRLPVEPRGNLDALGRVEWALEFTSRVVETALREAQERQSDADVAALQALAAELGLQRESWKNRPKPPRSA